MDEETKDLTATTLEKVLEWVEATEGFVIEQAPLLCQEIVRSGLVYSLGWFAVGIGVVATALFLGRRYFRMAVSMEVRPYPHSEPRVFALIFSLSIPIVLGAAWGMVAITHGLDAVHILVAPRLYIIEELSKMF